MRKGRYRPPDDTFDRLLRSCRRELDPTIAAAFAANIARAGVFCLIPFIGGVVLTYDERARQDAVKNVRRALCSKQCFAQTAPAWAPSLPIRIEKCNELIKGANNKRKLVGYYGRLLALGEWRYQRHPAFSVFCSGVMAASYLPADLANDLELRCMFRP